MHICLVDMILTGLIGLIFLKNLEIWMTSFYNLARIRDGIFLMLAEVVLSDALLLQLEVGMIMGVSLAEIFSLKDLVFLSVLRKSYLN